jgi:UDP-N-acetylmuramate dehydrogenase
MDPLFRELQKYGEVKTNISFTKLTTFEIGSNAKYLLTVTDTQKLIDALNYLKGKGIYFFILGGGSNLLMPDHDIEGVVIKIHTNKIEMIGDTAIAVDAGVGFGTLINLSFSKSLEGLEWGVGVPGTVGGAVRGNAGAMGKNIAGCLDKALVWRRGEVIEVKNADCGFTYRESKFKHNKDVILRAYFQLKPGDKKEIMLKAQAYMKQRTGRYPHLPSAGSFFKNIQISQWRGDINELPELFRERGMIPVGWVMEQMDLKGYTVGGAKISDEHGNFLINFDHATQADILKIVEMMKEKVYNKFGIILEPEVEIIP